MIIGICKICTLIQMIQDLPFAECVITLSDTVHTLRFKGVVNTHGDALAMGAIFTIDYGKIDLIFLLEQWQIL